MSDPLRTIPIESLPSAGGDAGRDAKIENLLLAGLDQYFSGGYAQAIDVWTRVLFLDRNHARARAYIERARSAMAEQQRESEELLHDGVAAFERGEIEAARQMLNAAVQRGGAHDVALAFLTRIDRIHAATPAAPFAAVPASRAPFRPGADTFPRRRRQWALAALAIIGMTAVIGVTPGDRLRLWIPALHTGAQDALVPARGLPESLIVPRSSETALDRARALFASGRLYDALRALDLVRATDPLRDEADRLKAAIQRELLSFRTSPAAGTGTSTTAASGQAAIAANP
jgi:tetratricopeptide (TPR) repeat protein